MSTVTREQALECLTKYVPLDNFFFVGEDNVIAGAIVFWHPQFGLRSLIIEKADLAQACRDLLQEYGVRRFESWQELDKAQKIEKWPGWDTCEDYRRMQQAMAELAKKGEE
jgi:hypothetical protein